MVFFALEREENGIGDDFEGGDLGDVVNCYDRFDGYNRLGSISKTTEEQLIISIRTIIRADLPDDLVRDNSHRPQLPPHAEATTRHSSKGLARPRHMQQAQREKVDMCFSRAVGLSKVYSVRVWVAVRVEICGK